MTKILFVCTGNIFRSTSAQFCLRKYVAKHKIKNIEVTSAGIEAFPEPMNKYVVRELNVLGMDPSEHKQTKITRKIAQEPDLVVAMAQNHVDFIKKHYHIDVPLFNQICYNENTSILDVEDVVPDWTYQPALMYVHLLNTVRHINDSMPNFVKNYKKYIKKKK